MHKLATGGWLTAVLLCFAGDIQGQDTPTKEHEWLRQLVGEWTYEAELTLEPGKPPVKTQGTESVRAIGALWVVLEVKGNVFGAPFTGVMTLGYDAKKKKPVATWIDSMNSHLLTYEGVIEGQRLTLLTEGPNPAAAGKTTRFKDVIEIKGKDEKTLSSFMELEEGKWTPFMKATYRRAK